MISNEMIESQDTYQWICFGYSGVNLVKLFVRFYQILCHSLRVNWDIRVSCVDTNNRFDTNFIIKIELAFSGDGVV